MFFLVEGGEAMVKTERCKCHACGGEKDILVTRRLYKDGTRMCDSCF